MSEFQTIQERILKHLQAARDAAREIAPLEKAVVGDNTSQLLVALRRAIERDDIRFEICFARERSAPGMARPGDLLISTTHHRVRFHTLPDEVVAVPFENLVRAESDDDDSSEIASQDGASLSGEMIAVRRWWRWALAMRRSFARFRVDDLEDRGSTPSNRTRQLAGVTTGT